MPVYKLIKPVKKGQTYPDMDINEVCPFNIKDGEWKIFNNYSDLPLKIGDIWLPNSEFLYQMFKYSHRRDLQQKLLDTRGGTQRTTFMRPKTRKRNFLEATHPDFNEARPILMEWVVRLKFAQHYDILAPLLEKTGNRDIVEYAVPPNKDRYWAVQADENVQTASGENHLGIIIMKIRDDYRKNNDSIKQVQPSGLDWLTILGFNCNVGYSRKDIFI